jgi:hypothetical protein
LLFQGLRRSRQTEVYWPGDVCGQMKRCPEILGDAVKGAGLSLDTVVRTRIMLTISQWEAAAHAHAEFFAAIQPATTFVESRVSLIATG